MQIHFFFLLDSFPDQWSHFPQQNIKVNDNSIDTTGECSGEDLHNSERVKGWRGEDIILFETTLIHNSGKYQRSVSFFGVWLLFHKSVLLDFKLYKYTVQVYITSLVTRAKDFKIRDSNRNRFFRPIWLIEVSEITKYHQYPIRTFSGIRCPELEETCSRTVGVNIEQSLALPFKRTSWRLYAVDLSLPGRANKGRVPSMTRESYPTWS